MSSSEFSDWQVYQTIEPLPYQDIMFSIAILSATVVNLFLGKNDEPAKPQDFLPNYDVKDDVKDQAKPGEIVVDQEKLKTKMEAWRANVNARAAMKQQAEGSG